MPTSTLVHPVRIAILVCNLATIAKRHRITDPKDLLPLLTRAIGKASDRRNLGLGRVNLHTLCIEACLFAAPNRKTRRHLTRKFADRQ